MPTVKQNALKILGWLYKNNVTLTSNMTVKEIKVALKMPPKEFDEADTYLLQEKLVGGFLAGDDGGRWLTSQGMNIAEEAAGKSNFWQRNKDEILIALITGIITFAAGLATGLLIR